MKKVKFLIEKIIEEPHITGVKLLKVFIRSGETQFTKVVRKIDYLNESSRVGLHQLWIKGIKEQQEEDSKDEGEIKKDTKALADIIGTGIEDE